MVKQGGGGAVWRWIAVCICTLVIVMVLGTAMRKDSTHMEGFSSGGDPLTTGVEVALWFPSHRFLRADTAEATGVQPGLSERLLVPEELPIGQGELLWVLEAAGDPPGVPARFQLFPNKEAIRIRNVTTGTYLVWIPSVPLVAPQASTTPSAVAATGELRLLRPDDTEWEDGTRALWHWERRRGAPDHGLQWGDRFVLHPAGSLQGALTVRQDTLTVLENVPSGSEEILLVDRFGRGREKEQARFGRARASTGPSSTDAYLAVDGREDTYCRLMPNRPNEGTWWELDLPMDKTWVERILVSLPDVQPSMAPTLRVSLWNDKARVAERTWTLTQAPLSTQHQNPIRVFTWDDVRTHVQTMRIEAEGPLYLAQVHVYGEPSALRAPSSGYVPPRTLLALPGGRVELGPNGPRNPIQRTGEEVPDLRHHLSVFHWLRVDTSGAPRSMLWEWTRNNRGPGWKVWMDPIKKALQWQVWDTKETLVQQLELILDDLLGRDAHVGWVLRSPINEAQGWYLVPGSYVVHPRWRIYYRLAAESPDLRLPLFSRRRRDIASMEDLGTLTEDHLHYALQLWVDGQKRAEVKEALSTEEAADRLIPDGAWRTVPSPGPFYAQLRSVRITNADPVEDMWASMLREGGLLVRLLSRFPVRPVELPASTGDLCFGAWVYPRARATTGEQRVVWQGPEKGRPAWTWTRQGDQEAMAVFSWMNLMFPLPLEEWSWVVLSFSTLKPRVFVQGRMIRSGMITQSAEFEGGLFATPVVAELQLQGCKIGNMSVVREEDSWTMRSTHPDSRAFDLIRRRWERVGCPGRWDFERDPGRTLRWLRILRREGANAMERHMHALYRRAQRYLRQESPRGEESEDRAAVDACYYPIPINTWDEHWEQAQKKTESRWKIAPKCLPMAPYVCTARGGALPPGTASAPLAPAMAHP